MSTLTIDEIRISTFLVEKFPRMNWGIKNGYNIVYIFCENFCFAIIQRYHNNTKQGAKCSKKMVLKLTLKVSVWENFNLKQLSTKKYLNSTEVSSVPTECSIMISQWWATEDITEMIFYPRTYFQHDLPAFAQSVFQIHFLYVYMLCRSVGVEMDDWNFLKEI